MLLRTANEFIVASAASRALGPAVLVNSMRASCRTGGRGAGCLTLGQSLKQLQDLTQGYEPAPSVSSWQQEYCSSKFSPASEDSAQQLQHQCCLARGHAVPTLPPARPPGLLESLGPRPPGQPFVPPREEQYPAGHTGEPGGSAIVSQSVSEQRAPCRDSVSAGQSLRTEEVLALVKGGTARAAVAAFRHVCGSAE